MATKQEANRLAHKLPANWWTETDGPNIYAYAGRGYGDDGPRFSADLEPLEFGQGWKVTVSGGEPGFHGPIESGKAYNMDEAAEYIRRVVNR